MYRVPILALARNPNFCMAVSTRLGDSGLSSVDFPAVVPLEGLLPLLTTNARLLPGVPGVRGRGSESDPIVVVPSV